MFNIDFSGIGDLRYVDLMILGVKEGIIGVRDRRSGYCDIAEVCGSGRSYMQWNILNKINNIFILCNI